MERVPNHIRSTTLTIAINGFLRCSGRRFQSSVGSLLQCHPRPHLPVVPPLPLFALRAECKVVQQDEEARTAETIGLTWRTLRKPVCTLFESQERREPSEIAHVGTKLRPYIKRAVNITTVEKCIGQVHPPLPAPLILYAPFTHGTTITGQRCQ